MEVRGLETTGLSGTCKYHVELAVCTAAQGMLSVCHRIVQDGASAVTQGINPLPAVLASYGAPVLASAAPVPSQLPVHVPDKAVAKGPNGGQPKQQTYPIPNYKAA